MRCANCGREVQQGALFCPHCGTKVLDKSALPSSSRVPGKKSMGTRAKMAYSSIAGVLLIGMGIVFLRSLPGGDHPVIVNQPTISQAENYDGSKFTMTPIPARVENGFIIISLADVVEKKMVSFTYEGKTKKVEMVAYINPHGKLVTSVAMCEPCNSKSFHSESQDLVCDNCGTRWNFSTLEGISGSCQKYPPDPIPSEIAGGEVRISKKLVEGWKLRI
jgi:DNA-directed RNA polymerase subunit RPC12/RpoP